MTARAEIPFGVSAFFMPGGNVTESVLSDSKQGVFERHAQSVVALLIAALVSWVGISTSQLREDFQAVKGDIRVINVEVSAVKDQLALANQDRYRASQANSDFKLRDQRIDQNSRRLDSLEQWAKDALKGRTL